jgi:hypothetical protein
LTPLAGSPYIRAAGRMAEWLCSGLQIRVQRFDSASGLQPIIGNNLFDGAGLPAHCPCKRNQS